MYYRSGNYETLARPRRPQGVEDKPAWFDGRTERVVGGFHKECAVHGTTEQKAGAAGGRLHHEFTKYLVEICRPAQTAQRNLSLSKTSIAVARALMR